MPDRLLVVDDEEVVLEAVRKALRHDDFEIDTALTAGGALRLLGSRRYALVITDLKMPGLDGLELLARIRELQLDLATIMLTGYPTIQSALQAKRLGAFEYVTKPFTRQELRSVLVRALRRTPRDAPREPSGNVWRIADHAWARLEDDGTARVGIAAAFLAGVGEVTGLQLPEAGALLEQGRASSLIQGSGSVEHTLYSPFSGRVLEVNQAVVDDPSLLRPGPEEANWLFRMLPSNVEREKASLTA